MTENRESKLPAASLVVLVLLVAAVALDCAKNPRGVSDAAAQSASSMLDAALERRDDADAPVTVGPDADPTLPTDLAAPPPPEVSCANDAATTACDLPPSTCAQPLGCDAGANACVSSWIVYYENPRCVGGRCVWDQSYFQCVNRGPCQTGACTPPGTTLP